MAISIVRTLKAFGRMAETRTSGYRKVREGLITPPVAIGPRASGLPEHEIDAILRARIAGKKDDEIRALVKQLIAQRTASA